jgi:hypothetical protein
MISGGTPIEMVTTKSPTDLNIESRVKHQLGHYWLYNIG